MHCFAPRLVTSLCLAVGCATFAQAQGGVALVRHAPAVSGTVDGSVQQMLPESVTLDGSAAVTGNLLVPGVPSVTIHGSPSFGGVVNGAGATTPGNYTVTLGGNANLGHLVTSTDALPLPTVAPPPDPTGSTTVTVSNSGRQGVDFSSLRNLTLNGNVGEMAVPAGTYGDFTANGSSGFTLGVAGATEPAVYNFQHLTLNGTNGLIVVGPVVVTVATAPVFSGAIGAVTHPEWLTLRISSGDLALNGKVTLYGFVVAPNGQVTLQGGSQVIGGLTSDRLTVNGNALLRLETVTTAPPPVATNETVTTAENTPVQFALTATQANGDPLNYTVVTQPTHGTLSGTAPNLTYTPALNYFGPDSFTFNASDGTVVSNTATVSITINEVTYPPVATPQSLSLVENTTLPITLTGTQTNNDPLTYAVVTQPAHGTLSGTAPNLAYTPEPNYVGADEFTFNAIDGTVTSTSPATVSITVTNAPPTATSQTVALVENTSTAITLSGTQVNGDALTFAISTQPAHGTLSGTAPNLTYTPAANFYGADSFTFTAIDGALSSAPATVSITVTEAPPVATAQALTVVENASLAITLAGSQVNGDALTFAVATQPTHGTLAGTPPNLTYTPANNYFGPDSFTFTANDGALSSAPATVAIAVTKAAPSAQNGSVTTVENTPVNLTLAASQVNGDALTYAIGTQPAHGTLSGTAPNLTYTPAANFFGADSFTFTAIDGPSSSAPATVSITVTEAPPVATPQVVTVSENASLAITLAGSQINGDALTFAVTTQPAHGTLTGTAPNLTYTPTANYSGPDSFTFAANDGSLVSAPATVSITVQPLVTTSTLTVINGVGTVLAGDTYTIVSNAAPAGTIFAGWVVNSGGGTFASAKLSQTTFAAAPQTATTIQATYVTLTATTDVNGDGIPDLLEIQAGALDPNDPSNPSDPKNTASQANLQNYSYDNDNQLTTAPESNYKYDKEGNASPDQK